MSEDSWSKRANARAAAIFPICHGRVSVGLYNTVLVGLSFFCIFLAFNTTQNFETSLNGDTGRISLGILYGCFAFTNLLSGFVVRRFGNRISMMAGGLSYVLFIAANINAKRHIDLFFAASAVIGVGASLIWTAQGSFLARQCAPETFGFYSGIFWALFQANGIFGNLMGQLLLGNRPGSENTLFFIFTIVASVGVGLMTLLIYPPDVDADVAQIQVDEAEAELPMPGYAHQHGAVTDDGDERTTDREETIALLLGTLRLFADKEMAHLIPLMIFSGLSQSFFFGGLPPLFGNDLGWGMMVLAGCDVVGSAAFGRLSDWAGRRLVLFLGALFTIAGALCAIFGNFEQAVHGLVGAPSRLWLMFIASMCFGFGDACFNTQLYTLIRHFCSTEDKAASGFGFYRLLQAGSSAAAFFYSIALTFLEQTELVLGLLILGLLFVAYLDYFVSPIDIDTKPFKEPTDRDTHSF